MAERPYVIDQMISAKAIAARVEELARDITDYFRGTDKLVVVGLLRGSFVFIADLVREIDLPVEVDFLEASSYGNSTESSREVRILKDLRSEIAGRDVLVVEDIVDTGYTLSHVVNLLRSRDPGRLEVCALLDKPSRREVDIRADLDGVRDPGRIRRRLRHRLRAAQPQPALYRQGPVPCRRGRAAMSYLWLLRAARWLRHPPSPARVKLVASVIVLCLALAAFAKYVGWPDWATTNSMGRVPKLHLN